MESPDGFERGVHVQLEKEAWGRAGCSEFLKKLNFEPTRQDFHGPWVTLSSAVVKLDRRTLHFATTAIMATFGECCYSIIILTWSCVVLILQVQKTHLLPINLP